MKQKEQAINRCAAFLKDRIQFSRNTGDWELLTQDAIKKLLVYEMQSVPDGEEVKVTW